jgi:16S rRNA (cytidine1402-2'-O)-methyltransferase
VGDAHDLTRRAARILTEVTLIVTSDKGRAQCLLDQHNIATALVSAGSVVALDALAAGDLALLTPGWSPGLAISDQKLIAAAIERGFPVVSCPGPALSLTALVISGLPADSFVHLGELPLRQPGHGELLTSLAGERRTLVVTTSPQNLPATLQDLYSTLGQRPVVVVSTPEGRTGVAWRGTLGDYPIETQTPTAGAGEPSPTGGNAAESPEPLPDQRTSDLLVLVIEGARGQVVCWEEERLRAEVHALRQQGLGASQIGRQLAAKSGWPRRHIYRLAVKNAAPGADMGWDSHAEPERE